MVWICVINDKKFEIKAEILQMFARKLDSDRLNDRAVGPGNNKLGSFLGLLIITLYCL